MNMDLVLSLLIPGSIFTHLALAPYTKVEESFNIQAIHDITTYGLPWPSQPSVVSQYYDHIHFPGAVPRTFVGALLFSGLSSPLLDWVKSPKYSQILVRAIIGLVNAVAILGLRNALRRNFGRTVGAWYCLLQASQFHIIFYASRTLPNMFAFSLTTFALRSFIVAEASPAMSPASSRRHGLSIALLTIAGVIFRSELAVLVFTQVIYLLAAGRVSLSKTIIPAGLFGAFIGLVITIPVDSLFWQKFPLWPEFVSFYYNTVRGKSSDWGTSPWYFYFTDSFPRLLLNPLTYTLLIPLAIGSPATRRGALGIFAPELAFVALYSFLPHKEWRFIVYIIPGMTAVSAMGASWIWTRRQKSLLYKALNFALVGSVALSFIVSSSLLAVSRLNYPGGEAMSRMHNLPDDANTTVHVFVDNLACQTGVTRFLEGRSEFINNQRKWHFDKTENETTLLDPQFWMQFDYAIVEHPERCIGKWELADVVTAFSGIKLVRPGDSIGPESTTAHLYLDERREKWQKWNDIGEFMRKRITRGWWVTVRMEPKIKILRRQLL